MWRVGRKVGRTIYLQKEDDQPSDEDNIVGLLDNEYLARLACESVNEVTELMRFLNHELNIGVPPGQSATDVAIRIMREQSRSKRRWFR